VILNELNPMAACGWLPSALVRALDFLRSAPADIPDGRHEIEGDRIYANVMSYETRDFGHRTHEAHRRYTDVQFLLQGEEQIYFTPATRLGTGSGYNAEKDYELFAAPEFPSRLALSAGQFVIFHPGEGHQPACIGKAPCAVRKIVVKVAV
jgi:YhcH/YjgK/YiaL family protein